MQKRNNENNFLSSEKKYDLSKIHKEIDEMILKNNKKNDIKNIDFQCISLKSKNGKHIYYLKKKDDKKPKKTSSKKINKNLTNLGEKQPKTKQKIKKSKSEDKEKNYIQDHKKPSDEPSESLEKDEILKIIKTSKKISEIESEKEEPAPHKPENVFQEIPIIENNKKTEEIEQSDKDETENISDFDLQTKEKNKKEYEELVKEIENKVDNLQIVKKEYPESKPDIKKEHSESKPEAPPSQFKFHIENKPDKEEINDAILIDKKIEQTPEVKEPNEVDKSEIKAQELFKEHLKDKPLDFNKDPFEANKTDKKTPSLTFSKEEAEHEHVFFDEHSDFDGWSPHTTGNEKKQSDLSLAPRLEVDFKKVKDVEIPKEILDIKSVTLSDLGFSQDDWNELEFYPLFEPFSYVEILQDKDTLEKRYFLVEVEITKEEEKILHFINETMKNISFEVDEYESVEDSEYLVKIIDQIVEEYNLKIPADSKTKILYHLGKSSFGFAKIDSLMRDPNIEDISCDGADIPIFLYHRKYGSLKSNIQFDSEDELSSFIYKLAQKCGKHISIAEPMLDATMPDGSRIQMTLSTEVTTKGSTFTIRKFKEDPFSPPDLVEYNTMSSEMVAYLWIAFEHGINVLFAGGTASGKTTALNAAALFIPTESKIVSIEETREINLPHSNWIPGVARSGFGPVVSDKLQGEIDLYDLMKAALRQRPEYIIVGEIRGREAYVLFQAMATGHATYSTVHADSAQSLIHRLEGKPINIPRVMLQSLDVICLHIITRVKNTRARRCKQIVEIIDIDPATKEILTNEVFRWDPVKDNFVYSGKSYILERVRAEKDISKEKMTQELKHRQNIIEWMNKNNLRGFRDVANIVSRYAENPTEILERIKSDVIINE